MGTYEFNIYPQKAGSPYFVLLNMVKKDLSAIEGHVAMQQLSQWMKNKHDKKNHMSSC
jgi:hypothetical protein